MVNEEVQCLSSHVPIIYKHTYMGYTYREMYSIHPYI